MNDRPVFGFTGTVPGAPPARLSACLGVTILHCHVCQSYMQLEPPAELPMYFLGRVITLEKQVQSVPKYTRIRLFDDSGRQISIPS